MLRLDLLVSMVILTSCLASPPAPTGGAPTGLTPSQLQRVGQRIWQNECDGTVAGLTSWNEGEDFASLGIGHFIWYPAGRSGPFEESFPPLVAYLQGAGVSLPAWLLQTPDCPWSSRKGFMADAQSAQQQDLRQLLASTVSLQTQFIIARLNGAVPRLMRAGGEQVQRSYALLSQTPEGMFAMIDYINFKGDGLKAEERYQGQGWGLAQVLAGMTASGAGDAPAAFAASAKRVLSTRVKLAPPGRNEGRWLSGWHSRCDAYARPL